MLTSDSLVDAQTAILSSIATLHLLVQHMSPRPLPLSLAIALVLAGLGGVSARAGNGIATDKEAKSDKEALNKSSAEKINAEKIKDNGNQDTGTQDNTLPASVRRIERETGGKVLKAQPIQRDGREIYRVKIVTPQGRVRVMEDDAGPTPSPAPAQDAAPPSRLRHRP